MLKLISSKYRKNKRKPFHVLQTSKRVESLLRYRVHALQHSSDDLQDASALQTALDKTHAITQSIGSAKPWTSSYITAQLVCFYTILVITVVLYYFLKALLTI